MLLFPFEIIDEKIIYKYYLNLLLISLWTLGLRSLFNCLKEEMITNVSRNIVPKDVGTLSPSKILHHFLFTRGIFLIFFSGLKSFKTYIKVKEKQRSTSMELTNKILHFHCSWADTVMQEKIWEVPNRVFSIGLHSGVYKHKGS